jgi:tetratricopeptide (TPR) repeat protein
MELAIIGLVATVVAFKIISMTTGRQAAAPLYKKKFLTYLGVLVALLGYCVFGAFFRTGGSSAIDPEARLFNLRIQADALRLQGRTAEAAQVSTEALSLSEKAYGKEDARITPFLNLHASSLQAQGNYGEAEGLRKRALALALKANGENHPEVALQENNLGAMYAEMGQLEKAEPLYRKALSKTERFTGQIPPVLPVVLENLAALCERSDRTEEAGRLRDRAKGYRPGR